MKIFKVFMLSTISLIAISCAPNPNMNNNYVICDDTINADCGPPSNVVIVNEMETDNDNTKTP